MPKFVMVLGAEGSGTRLVTRILLTVDGARGTDDHFQAIDTVFSKSSDARSVEFLSEHWLDSPLAVMRRSLPHSNRWPPLSRFGDIVTAAGFDLWVVMVVRDNWACVQAMRRAGHVSREGRGYRNYQRAYRTIFTWLNEAGLGPKMIIMPYEALVLGQHACAQQTLGRPLGLELPKDKFPNVFDGNEKYYERRGN